MYTAVKRTPPPHDLCACGGSKLAASPRCRRCSNQSRTRGRRASAAEIAEALRRDPRDDGEKVDARLTLLKVMWREATHDHR